MITGIFLFVLISIQLSAESEYILLTGSRHESLPDSSEIRTYLTNFPGSYEEIALVLIKSGDSAERIYRAKKIAQELGGNGVIPQEEELKSCLWYKPIYSQNNEVVDYIRIKIEWIEQNFVIINNQVKD